MKSLNKICFAVLLAVGITLVAAAENITVNCGHGKGHGTISAAVAKLSEQASHTAPAPSTITVTGTCVENVTIISLDNLTLQAGPKGATISDASGGTLDTILVIDSNRFGLNGFTINGSVDCANNAVCRLNGNTIQNSQVGYGVRASRAHIDSANDNISNNPSGNGIQLVNQSRAALADDTISNNGGNGIQVFTGSLVVVSANNTTTTISNNGGMGVFARHNGTVRVTFANITGNGGDGVRVADGSVLRTDFVGAAVDNITGNGGAGVNIGDLSHAFFANDGSVNVSGNSGGFDVFCAGQFPATRNVAATGGTTNCVEPVPEKPRHK